MKILDIPRSGSYAGVTSSHNRAGQYVRNRRTPVNTPTARRTLIRSAFGASSSGWAGLTSAEQSSWAAAAAAHPITDSLGQSITLTGQQLYVSINTQLQNVGQALVTVPPATFAVFSTSGATASFSVATGFAGVPTGTGASTDFLLVAFSKPTSAGRTFNKTFTQQQHVAGDAVTVTLTTAAYGALFGTPVAGQRVFVKFTPVNQYGVTGVPLVIPITVTA